MSCVHGTRDISIAPGLSSKRHILPDLKLCLQHPCSLCVHAGCAVGIWVDAEVWSLGVGGH